jgi:hypothetical protein
MFFLSLTTTEIRQKGTSYEKMIMTMPSDPLILVLFSPSRLSFCKKTGPQMMMSGAAFP